MAILTYPLNGILYDAEDAEVYNCTRTSGVFAEEGHFPASVTGTREVSIGPGLAWMQNEEFHGKAVYNPETEVLEIAEADAYQRRIDRIVLRFDKLLNQTTLEVKQGTPASSPSAPAITRDAYTYELGLYTVSVSASSVSVSDSDISSTMLDENVCGLMRDGVTRLPTQELYDQWYAWFEAIVDDMDAFEAQLNIWFQELKDESEAFMQETEEAMTEWKDEQQKEFDEWFDNLQYVLDGDVAGKLEVEIETAQDTADAAMEQLASGWVEGFLTDEAEGGEYGLLADDSDENYAITISRPICNCDEMGNDLISDEFVISHNYSEGDYCIYGNMLFRFTSAKAAGAWDYSKVEQTTVAKELSGIYSSATLSINSLKSETQSSIQTLQSTISEQEAKIAEMSQTVDEIYIEMNHEAEVEPGIVIPADEEN